MPQFDKVVKKIMGFSCCTCTYLINAFLLLSSIYFDLNSAKSTLTSTQFIRDPEIVSSNDGAIRLGFFSPVNTTNRYVGIWYLNESNVIWVANRFEPVMNSSGIFTIAEDGNLVVSNGQRQVVWSSNVSAVAPNSTAQLLDSGNLILLDATTGETVWESFQHPIDTIVPKMKLSSNRITGRKIRFASWKSLSDPSTGYYSVTLERLDAPEVIIWVNETHPYFRTGPWNGEVFIGFPTMLIGYLYGWSVGNEEDGSVYLVYNFPNESSFRTLGLDPQGNFKLALWSRRKEIWRKTLVSTACDLYGACGAFGLCNWRSTQICSCLNGYEPRNLEEWNRQNWTSGCVRKEPFQCERLKNGSEVGNQDAFLKLEMMKVPDFTERSGAMEDECGGQCLKNCSCLAYAYEPGVGCMYWTRDLIDIQRFSKGGVDLYIRVVHSELEKHKDKKRTKRVIIAVAVTVGTITLAASAYLSWKWTAKQTGGRKGMIEDKTRLKLEDLPVISFEKLVIATDNFHTNNMLGKGGFGAVYKGELQDGQEIAVKRLSKASGQGLEEFMNEVAVISKLQHRNLIKLFGCCVEGNEKMLIYEFMPNKSLDVFLFDPLQGKFLDWRKRYDIIEGIARGLLYLHKDSRLRIIHRDLKASNILLDAQMNPKISDFGLARIFKDDEDHVNTKRVAGTYGYMSPEYAMRGLFSEKSDVYSFGVLLLEIISGKRNTSFYDDEENLNLIRFAWKLWNEDKIVSLIDEEIAHSSYLDHILRCIQIGLLCVQEFARERPSMTAVVSMLNSEVVNLPPPRQVAFIPQRKNPWSQESPNEHHRPHSINTLSVTDMHGR